MKIKINILFFLLILCILLSLLIGAQSISLREALKNADSFSRTIFINLRLPRTILVFTAGAMLAGSGGVFQQFFRNPLSDPGIIGVSSGAALGAVIASFVKINLNIGSFFGAIFSGLLITFFAGRKTLSNQFSSSALLLCGTAFGSLYSSCVAIILSMQEAKMRSIYMWMLGSFSGRTWNDVFIIVPTSIVASIFLFLCARPLDVLNGGEVSAEALGVNIPLLRASVIASCSLAVSAAVCAGGTIGFVGLAAPHIARKIYGAKTFSLLAFSMMIGSILLLLADTLSRVVIAPAELPVGTITTLCGAPFFIWLLNTKKD